METLSNVVMIFEYNMNASRMA